jgi:hypothetical protein
MCLLPDHRYDDRAASIYDDRAASDGLRHVRCVHRAADPTVAVALGPAAVPRGHRQKRLLCPPNFQAPAPVSTKSVAKPSAYPMTIIQPTSVGSE